METDEPKFVQAAPSVGEKLEAQEVKLPEGRVQTGWGRQLKEDEVEEDADGFLCWLVRYPVERNHPRPTTGTIQVKKSGDAVVCMSNDKVSDVMQKLIVEGFLAVPVLSSADGRLIGWIDFLDIVWYTLWSFGAWREEQQGAGREQVLESREHFGTFLSLERFRNAQITDVLGRPGFGTRNMATHVFKGFSLFHVFETMARLSTHRVAICNAERKVTGLITQSMVISLLDQHLDRMGTLCSSHLVAEMIPGLYEDLRTVHESDLALTAFKTMVQHNVSGLAVVDQAGVLVDTISVRDLRGMGATADNWTNLWSNVRDFKSYCRSKFSQQTPASPIWVSREDTLETVIRKMDDGNIHRIFVCSEREGKLIPSHCISQRDVMRFLLYLCGLKNTALEDLERAQELE